MNKAIRFALVFLILILALPWSVLAQEAQETEKSPESLELPDVVVYGVDTSFRQGGEKCAPTAYTAPAVTPPSTIAYPAAPHSEGEISFSESVQFLSDRHTLLSSYIGPYTSWGLRALHQRMIKKVSLRLFANLEGTDGQYTDSDGTWGEIHSKVDVPVSEDIACGLDLGYRRWSYGLYGAEMFEGNVHQDLFSVKTRMEARQSEQTSVQAGLGYQRFALSLPWSGDRYEDLFQADLGLQTRYGHVDILAHLNWTGDRPSAESLVEPDAYKTAAFDLPSGDLLSASCEAKSQILPRLSAGLGGTLQSYMSENEEDRTRFFPWAEACYRPAEMLAIYASLQGAFRYHPLAELHSTNPYVAQMVSASVIEERRWQMETSMEAEVRPDLILKGSYQWAQDRNTMFWQWNDGLGLFSIDKLKEIRQHRLKVSAQYTFLEAGQAQIGYTFTDYEIHDLFYSSVTGSDRIPFRPHHEMWTTAEYSIPAWFDIRADVRWIGERISRLMRPFDSYFNPFELDPYFLVNVELNRNIHKNIDAFIYLRNLTDSDYALWTNYPEMGINIYGGVKIVL